MSSKKDSYDKPSRKVTRVLGQTDHGHRNNETSIRLDQPGPPSGQIGCTSNSPQWRVRPKKQSNSPNGQVGSNEQSNSPARRVGPNEQSNSLARRALFSTCSVSMTGTRLLDKLAKAVRYLVLLFQSNYVRLDPRKGYIGSLS
ncbi:hypothetical protein YC2023_011409 [Brassica napus]